MNKKSILKKACCGQGGPVAIAKDIGKNIARRVAPAVLGAPATSSIGKMGQAIKNRPLVAPNPMTPRALPAPSFKPMPKTTPAPRGQLMPKETPAPRGQIDPRDMQKMPSVSKPFPKLPTSMPMPRKFPRLPTVMPRPRQLAPKSIGTKDKLKKIIKDRSQGGYQPSIVKVKRV